MQSALDKVRARLSEILAAAPVFTLDHETSRRIDALAAGGVGT